MVTFCDITSGLGDAHQRIPFNFNAPSFFIAFLQLHRKLETLLERKAIFTVTQTVAVSLHSEDG